VVASAGRLVIDGGDAAAAALGLHPGMPLADARALEPGLAVRDADPVADRRALEDLADWCGRYTPWVALEAAPAQGAGGLWLDVTGAAHLFGGEAALLTDLNARLAGFGYTARAALADTPGAAWALARFEVRAAAGLVLPPGGAAAALRELPVAGLRLASATVDDLQRFGLGRIGSLYDIARAPLAARFGDQVARRLDQALGRLREPISPRRPVPERRARRLFAEPISTEAAITRAVRALLAELCAGLERQGSGARRLELAIFRLDGAVRRLPIGTHRAVRAPEHLFRLLAEHLDKLDYTVGVEVMTLAATATEPMAAVQMSFGTRVAPPSPSPLRGEGRGEGAPRGKSPANHLHFTGGRPPPPGSSPGAGPLPGGEREAGPDIAPLLDRLTNRLGRAAVTRPVARASHLPERAQILLPLLEAAPPAPAEPAESFRSKAARPPRLLVRPEPIEAVALVPDDPPRQFRWRGRTHQVRRAEGPERIAPEWWRRDGAPRDYYRIEDSEGGRYWVYRDGLYDAPQASGAEPRWYLHGLFA
jgi:protein ImuB